MATSLTYRTPGGQVPAIYLNMLDQAHCLIAGASGSGKSVAINGLIATLLTKYSPNKAQLVLVDPKRVELATYAGLPHTIAHWTEPDQIASGLTSVLDEIDRRYKIAAAQGVRTYQGAHIYVIIDELADLMTTDKKRIQPALQRIMQIGRAALVHVVAATQCPLASVIPTPIKCNFSGVLGLRTRSAQDSRNILGFNGLETLPLYGRGIYMAPGVQPELIPIRLTSDTEQQRLIQYWTSDQCVA